MNYNKMSSNTKPIDEPEPQLVKDDDVLVGLDERLADLMQLGWILVAESCPLEACRCPLLRSMDGNKYCVNCETWIFDKEKKKQKFTDLVKIGPQEVDIKEVGLTKVRKMMNYGSINLIKANIIQSLQVKLAYLSSSLNQTNDLNKSQLILNCMKSCIDNIASINQTL